MVFLNVGQLIDGEVDVMVGCGGAVNKQLEQVAEVIGQMEEIKGALKQKGSGMSEVERQALESELSRLKSKCDDGFPLT